MTDAEIVAEIRRVVNGKVEWLDGDRGTEVVLIGSQAFPFSRSTPTLAECVRLEAIRRIIEGDEHGK